MSESGPKAPPGFMFSTASQSAARAHALLPDRGTEDVSGILYKWNDDPKTNETHEVAGKPDYLPDPVVEWVIDLEVEGGGMIPLARVKELYPAFRRQAGLNLLWFGKESGTGRWTFVIAADVNPPGFTALKVALRLRFHDAQKNPVRRDQLERGLEAVRTLCNTLGSTKMVVRESLEDAAARAMELDRIWNECGGFVDIVLAAPDERRQIWDVMLSLGLRWGDMDLFHWENHSEDGDQAHFSVGTSTPPGYFLPEEIASGRVRVSDLLFGFSVARSRDPEIVFQTMVRAAEYARGRLGGELLGASGEAFSPDEELAAIQRIVTAMSKVGLTPGRDSALRLF